MNSNIFFWTRHGRYGFLSNFFLSPIELGGKLYLTVEHFYQANKTLVPEERQMIENLGTAKEAKLAGYHVTLRKDWEDIKENIMVAGLRAKFTQHCALKEQLLSTGDAILHEDSPWDKYWGYAKGKGLDRLGKLLMEVRQKIKDEPETA